MPLSMPGAAWTAARGLSLGNWDLALAGAPAPAFLGSGSAWCEASYLSHPVS